MEADFNISAEEVKAWQEKQKKRDEVSNVMGEYLLKGYRMLDSYCSDCSSILMSGPGGEKEIICIQCMKTGKSETLQQATAMPANDTPTGTIVTPPPNLPVLSVTSGEEMEATRKTLLSKLTWARNELEHSSSVEYCTQLCHLIQSIAATIKELSH